MVVYRNIFLTRASLFPVRRVVIHINSIRTPCRYVYLCDVCTGLCNKTEFLNFEFG
jgi:hypothetical protein